MSVITPVLAPAEQKILGTNVLLMGPTKTGKTTALKSLRKVEGLEIFALFTEPRYDVLEKEFLDSIHWRYIPPGNTDWKVLLNTAQQVNLLSNEALQKIQGVEQQRLNQFLQIISQCNNFIDQNGKEWGDIAKWGTNRVFITDGLTGINKMSRFNAVGMKPILSQPDWGVAMNTVQMWVDTVCTSTRCHFILLAHVDMEIDEVLGGRKVMVSTLGRKLAPLLPVNFSDVILSVKEGTNFYWDTASIAADVGSANLPLKAKQDPDFAPIFKRWRERGGVFEP